MQSLHIITEVVQDNIMCSLVEIGNMPSGYPLYHLASGYLIQTLAALDKDKTSKWQSKLKDKSQELSKKINVTAKLHLDNYIRSLEDGAASYHTTTVWLDACLVVLKDLLTIRSIHSEESKLWKENAVKLFHFVKGISDIRKMSTIDLSRFVKSLSLVQETGIISTNADILTESSLELFYRRNKFGFFCFDAYNHSTLPISKQFFVFDCLLKCRQNTFIKDIIRETLKVFNNLCSMARTNPTGHFMFRRGELITYSAENIGNILMGLSALWLYVEDISQRKSIAQILDELYFKLLLSHLKGRKTTNNSVKYSHLLIESDIVTHISESLNTLFADRIILNFSEQSITFKPHHSISSWKTLYLCKCLLDVSKRMKLTSQLY